MRDYKRAALVLTALGVVAIYGAALAYPVDRPERAAREWISLPEVPFAAREMRAREMRARKERADVMIAAGTVEKLRAAFSSIAFELKAVRQGEQRVPRVFLASLPEDFDRRMVIDQRKRTFVKTALPLILKANEEVLADRRRLIGIEERLSSGLTLPAEAEIWLSKLSEKYGTADGDTATLLRRVDAVSPGLALAQSIEESGWGRSRFARTGNALFGQRAWNENAGLVPARRGEDESFVVRSYASLLDSVRAYVHNLNSHPAYTDYRSARAQLRATETELDPFALADSMLFYSERREEYVDTLKGLIRSNRLHHFETAKLDTSPVEIDDIRVAAR